MLSKWKAAKPIEREKHFLVSKVIKPELATENLEWVDLEAVHSKLTYRIKWRELEDETKWLRGWV
jgi:tryptophan-rich hypothetical protein